MNLTSLPLFQGLTAPTLTAMREHGALPRKTFSIGHSRDKRYYLEARALQR